MNHCTVKAFWDCYHSIPPEVRTLADKNFALLKENPWHPSVRLKKVGDWYSARVGKNFRALAIPDQGDLIWFWIGTHAEYDSLMG